MSYYRYDQGRSRNCWVYAGAQCVVSHMLTRYGLILDFNNVCERGIGSSMPHHTGSFFEFCDNLSKCQVQSNNDDIRYALHVQPKNILHLVTKNIQLPFNFWHGLTPYVVVKLDQGYHAMAALRYTHDSHGNKTGILCKNSWAGISGMTREVALTEVKEMYEIDVTQVLRCRNLADGNPVHSSVSPLPGLSGDGWGDLLSRVATAILAAEATKQGAEGKEGEPFDIDYVVSQLKLEYWKTQQTQGELVQEDMTNEGVQLPFPLPNQRPPNAHQRYRTRQQRQQPHHQQHKRWSPVSKTTITTAATTTPTATALELAHQRIVQQQQRWIPRQLRAGQQNDQESKRTTESHQAVAL